MCAMRVLCCLDGSNAEQISKTVSTTLNTTELIVGLLYVIDSSPHEEIDRTRERFIGRTGPLAGRQHQIQQADEAAAQDILDEGERYLPGAEKLRRVGRPEREIVNCAAEWMADLIVIYPRSRYDNKPEIGPKSVGHVARFVLDHAPCPVLLVRPVAREKFPLQR